MKQTIILCATLILASSCSDKLSKRDAFNLLEKQYPIELYYQVFTADPNHAQKMQKEGLTTSGFVTIDNGSFIF